MTADKGTQTVTNAIPKQTKFSPWDMFVMPNTLVMNVKGRKQQLKMVRSLTFSPC